MSYAILSATATSLAGKGRENMTIIWIHWHDSTKHSTTLALWTMGSLWLMLLRASTKPAMPGIRKHIIFSSTSPVKEGQYLPFLFYSTISQVVLLPTLYARRLWPCEAPSTEFLLFPFFSFFISIFFWPSSHGKKTY
jgi:hypothetical protein